MGVTLEKEYPMEGFTPSKRNLENFMSQEIEYTHTHTRVNVCACVCMSVCVCMHRGDNELQFLAVAVPLI